MDCLFKKRCIGEISYSWFKIKDGLSHSRVSRFKCGRLQKNTMKNSSKLKPRTIEVAQIL